MEESNNNEDVPRVEEELIGWDKDDKLELLYAIKSFGSSNISEICQSFPTKSSEGVQAAINYYKAKAILQKKASLKRGTEGKCRKSKPKIPLASWAKFLTDSLAYKELQTETSTALNLIASLEALPPAVNTENIDLKKIYHLLANALEGKPIPEDKLSGAVLKKCMIETALVSKAFLRTSTFRYLVGSLNISDKTINVFPKPTNDHELTTLRHLISQRAYNPLSIPEEHLKPSSIPSD